MIEVEKGCFGYPGGEQILKNIDMRLGPEKILAILGPNGIGKTTLLKCMIGLLPWTKGRTLLDGRNIKDLKRKRSGAGYPIYRSPTDLHFPIQALRWSCWAAALIWDYFSSRGKRRLIWRRP